MASGSPEPQGEEGAVTGAVSGAGLGALIAGAAPSVIPGIGPVIAIGTLAVVVLGGTAAGAAAGGIIGALVGMDVPEEEARRYEQEFRAGRTLVTVRADGQYEQAAAILRRHDATVEPAAREGELGTGT